MRLFLRTFTAYLLGVFITGAMLFIPAGTLDYNGAWLFMMLLFVPILIVGIVLLVKDPELLCKRLEMKEREKTQKGVVGLSTLLLIGSFIVAGFDFRHHWSHVPDTITIAASVVLLIGYALYAEVLRENVFLSRVIEVQIGQHVIDTGLYAIVRHPMYLAVTLIYLSMPLVLGSWWALMVILPCVLLLLIRIKNEEHVLCQKLPGYTNYMKRTRYRMIPFVW